MSETRGSRGPSGVLFLDSLVSDFVDRKTASSDRPDRGQQEGALSFVFMIDETLAVVRCPRAKFLKQEFLSNAAGGINQLRID